MTTDIAAVSKGGGWSASPTARQEYIDRQLGMFIHFGLETFNDVEYTNGQEPVNDFNPSALDIDQWVDAAEALDAGYAVLTAKHHSGFCLWPSATTTYDVAATTWYGSGYDIVQEYVDAFRAADIEPLFYFSIWDKRYEFENPGYTQAGYRALLEAQITELLTNYGPIKGLWLDGGLWHFSSYYPWDSASQRNAFIKGLQADCLIIDNSHALTHVDTDIVVYEADISGVDIPFGNALFAEKCLTIDTNGWFWKSTGYAVREQEYLSGRLYRANARKGAMLINLPPSNIGTIPTEYVTVAERVGDARRSATVASGIRAAIWLDPSDLNSLKLERTGSAATTPASVDGVVGSIRNKGYLGGWLIAAADGNRATLRGSGSIYWLEFDGSTDKYILSGTGGQWAGGDGAITSFAGFRRPTAVNITAGQAGNTPPRPVDWQIFSNRMYVGGLTDIYQSAVYSETNVDRVVAAKAHVVLPSLRLNGADQSLSVASARLWSELPLVSLFSPDGGVNGASRLYQYISCFDDLDAAQIAAVEAIVAAKTGVTL